MSWSNAPQRTLFSRGEAGVDRVLRGRIETAINFRRAHPPWRAGPRIRKNRYSTTYESFFNILLEPAATLEME
jgi:hypothetical protein